MIHILLLFVIVIYFTNLRIQLQKIVYPFFWALYLFTLHEMYSGTPITPIHIAIPNATFSCNEKDIIANYIV